MTRHPYREFDRVTTPTALRKIYDGRVEHSSGRGRDGITARDLREHDPAIFERLAEKLRTGKHSFTPYREKLVLKGADSKPRQISIATARDRVALRALTEFLYAVFPESRPTIPHAVVSRVARSLTQQDFTGFVRGDIAGFYPSVPHALLERELRGRIRKRAAIDVLLKAVRTPTVADGEGTPISGPSQGVPQGLAISNALANIALASLDRHFSERNDLAYFRYVDDVLILCAKGDTSILLEELTAVASQDGFKVHPPTPNSVKTTLGSPESGISYLGYIFLPSKITVTPKSLRNVESRIARELAAYRREQRQGIAYAEARATWRINLAITGCRFKGADKGWLPYYRQLTDLSLLKRLDALVARLASRAGLHGVEIKSFTKAYWHLSRGAGPRFYRPDFDQMNKQQRQEVVALLQPSLDLTVTPDSEIDHLFWKLVGKLVRTYENDVAARY